MTSDILYLRLVNGEHVAAKYVADSNEYLTVEWPMLVDQRSVDGTPAINLIKYLPFNTEQYIDFMKNHIIAMSVVNTAFAQYYYNSVHYHTLHVQPQTDLNLVQINKTLESVLSDDNQKFIDAMKEHEDKIPDTLSTSVH
jgi:hypothetical protein